MQLHLPMDFLRLLINKDVRPDSFSRRRNWDEYFFVFNPLFPCALSVVFGVCLAHVFPAVSSVILLAAAVVLLVGCFLLRHVPHISTGIILLLFALSGFLLLQMERRSFQIDYPSRLVISQAMITSEPARHGKVVMCDMVFVRGALCGSKVRTSIFGEYSCRAGDVVVMKSHLKVPQDFASEGKFKTSYTTYLKSRGVVAQTFVLPHNIQSCSESEITLPFHLQVWRRALQFRSRLLQVFVEYKADFITQGYLSAVLLGSRTQLSSRIRDDYSKSGVSHVLALSGMHLGILYGLFSLFLFRRKNVVCQLLLLSAIWCYVLMVGFPVSAVRAAMMLSVCTLVQLAGRRGLTLNTLSFSALVMVLFHPYCVFDVGFQLSYLSVGFITMFSPPLYRFITPWRLGRIRGYSWLSGMVAVSLAAQLGTFPLVLYYFGSFSFVFLLSNVVVLPLTTLVLSLGVAVLLPGIFGWYFPWLFRLLSFFVHSQNSVVSWLSSLPFSSLQGVQVSLLGTAVMYIVLFVLIVLIVFLSRRMA